MPSYLRLIGVAVLIFSNSIASAATVSWAGVLRDATGGPVSAATIGLIDASGHPAYTATTTSTGAFAFSDILESKYEITVTTLPTSFKSATLIEVKDGIRLPTLLQL